MKRRLSRAWRRWLYGDHRRDCNIITNIRWEIFSNEPHRNS